MVDRHHRPGGHWNEAYPFVRLHQPAAYYGVNSRELGQGTKDTVGLNAGMYGLSSGAELLAYFDQVMQQRFLPSGRVRFLPMSQVVGAYEVESLVTGARQPVKVRKKVVDGTHSRMQVPATTPPRYSVAPGVRCVPVNELARLAQPQAGYVVVGAGKTGMDACIWLLEQGVDPDHIRWIMPRDSWVLDRANVQSGDEFFMNTWGTMTRQLEAVVAAQERAGPDAAARSRRRVDAHRPQRDAHRLPRCHPQPGRTGPVAPHPRHRQARPCEGHRCRVRSISSRAASRWPPARWWWIAARPASPASEAVPVWAGDRITPQWLRSFGTVFSAALIAHVEATVDDDAEKNALCTPIVPPTLATDWLRMLDVSMKNQQRWSRHPELQQWLAESRLNSLFHPAGRIRPDETEKIALMQRYRQAIKPAVARLSELIATLA